VKDYPAATALRDWNEDGNTDFTYVSSEDKLLVTLLGNGDGSFREAIVGPDLAELLEIGDEWTSFTFRVADLNGDERPDLLVSSYDSAARVLFGNGDGTFAPGAVLPPLPVGPAGLAIEDFDEDGDLDLAHFKAAEAPICALQLYRGNGDGSFAPVSEILGDGDCNFLAIAAGDLDDDGDADIVTIDTIEGSVRVLLNNGDVTFVSGAAMPLASKTLALRDFDDDGHLDVAASAFCTRGGNGVGYVLLGKGDGTFELAVATDFGQAICELPPFGHVNRDAFLDVLAFHVGFGRGDGGFDNGRALRFQGAPADFNGDGLIDLANATFGRLDIFIGQGDGTFKGCYR
jgi:hypothetical protein